MTRRLHPATVLAAALAAAVSTPSSADPITAVGRAVHTGPTPRGAAFAQSLGYGFTGGVLAEDDAHHRLSASLTAELRPAGWLAAGVRFDGRYDMHDTGDDGWVGDPHVYLRAGARRGPVAFGARASLWLPGADAPSLVADAASFDVVALLAWSRGPVTLLANAGLRLDRSSASAPNADRLSDADRLALGVSDFDAALFAANVSWRPSRTELFAEWSWDLLVGDGAPHPLASPMRVGAGARRTLAAGWTLEAIVEVDPGRRPTLDPGAPLVPVEPRLSALVGVTYVPAATARPLVIPIARPDLDARRLPLPGNVIGHVRGADVGPLAGATVRAGGTTLTTDAEGGFRIDGVSGDLELTVEAEGFQPMTQTATPPPGGVIDVEVVLPPILPEGQIRGVVHSLGGEPIAAHVTIEPLGKKVKIEADGSFRVDVPPGVYEVVVRKSGYASQHRRVRVEEQGVVVLNVELSRK